MSGEFKPPTDPSAQAGSIDPTVLGNQEHTLALLTGEQLKRTSSNMNQTEWYRENPNHNISPGMRLARDSEGTLTLEGQCNANYRYLNGEGISMDQYTAVLDTYGALFDGMSQNDERALHQRSDHHTEFTTTRPGKGLTGPLDGRQVEGLCLNPLTGEPTQTRLLILDLGNRSRSSVTVSTLEIELAKAGIFDAPMYTASSEITRAEQIITGLRNMEIGQALLDEQGIDRESPAEPIALIQEPERITDAERNRQVTTRLTQGVEQLFQDAPALWVQEKKLVTDPRYPRSKPRQARKMYDESSNTSHSIEFSQPVFDGYVCGFDNKIRRDVLDGVATYRVERIEFRERGIPVKRQYLWQEGGEVRSRDIGKSLDDPYSSWMAGFPKSDSARDLAEFRELDGLFEAVTEYRNEAGLKPEIIPDETLKERSVLGRIGSGVLRATGTRKKT